MRAWYLKVDSSPAGAVLVGDRGRVLVAADMLDDATLLNEDRGLTTVVGSWGSTDVIVAAFGMGAPVAAVVMHELAAVSGRSFTKAPRSPTGSTHHRSTSTRTSPTPSKLPAPVFPSSVAPSLRATASTRR